MVEEWLENGSRRSAALNACNVPRDEFWPSVIHNRFRNRVLPSNDACNASLRGAKRRSNPVFWTLDYFASLAMTRVAVSLPPVT
jgi:hypothetical protein